MSIRKRGNTWHVHLADDDVVAQLGKPFRKSLGTSDKATARMMERKIRHEILSGTYGNVGESMMLTVAVDKAYKEHWQYLKDGRGALARISIVQRALGDIELRNIDAVKVQQLVQHCRREGNSNATINRKLAALKTLMKMAKNEWGLMIEVPYMKGLTEKARVLANISSEEEERMGRWLNENGYEDMHLLLTVLIDTGLRLSEALAIGGTTQHVIGAQHHLHVTEAKSGRDRYVPMTGRVVKLLSERPQKPFRELEMGRVQYQWGRMRSSLGLDYRLHDLRHTCASRLVGRGVDLYVVKEWLGHSTIQVTERYAHLQRSSLEAARDALEHNQKHNVG